MRFREGGGVGVLGFLEHVPFFKIWLESLAITLSSSPLSAPVRKTPFPNYFKRKYPDSVDAHYREKFNKTLS